MLSRRAENRTPGTIGWYDARLRQFAAHLSNPAGSSVTADDVRRFLVAVKAGTEGRPVADSYVEGFRKAIAAMFTWTVEEGLLKKSPATHVARFVCERRLPTVYSNIEVESLIDAAQPRSRLGSRNQAMFLLMFDTGIRIGELETATLRGLDLEPFCA